MENVVYILGAGFSAPLGLPLMDNFWPKAQQLSQSGDQAFSYIGPLVQKMRQTNQVADYFDYPRFNIEEALSILEMQEILSGRSDLKEFKRMVADVIRKYTPDIPANEKGFAGNDWVSRIFGIPPDAPEGGSFWTLYGHFVASLHRTKLTRKKIDDYGQPKGVLEITGHSDTGTRYEVITLNYDTVLENVCEYLNANTEKKSYELHFTENVNDLLPKDRPALAKLHGSVNTEIILPTYNKGLYQTKMPDSWVLAYELLVRANQIRIIGYSLPKTDAYIKYLLKSAIGQSGQLRRIDILCLDDTDHTVEKKYGEFVSFKGFYKFVNARVEDYLGKIYQLRGRQVSPTSPEEYFFDKIEIAHKELFG